jgi:microcystin-dependent protein
VAEPFLGEIRMFGGNFAPRGHAFCNGQSLPIAQNDALFALIGTTYGGDGQVTFNLPDLRGRIPIHQGHGPGLGTYVIGQVAGSETVTLVAQQLPAHTHSVACSTAAANQNSPTGRFWASDPGAESASYTNGAPNILMSGGATTPAGGSQPHANIQPYLCISFIIALEGIFPSRN